MKTRRPSSVLLPLLVGAGCNLKDLPPDAPQFAFEFSNAVRAESQFCFIDDSEAPILDQDRPTFIRNGGCARFTVLRPDGTPITGDLESSSCSLKTDESGLGANQELGLVLRTEDFEDPLSGETVATPFADPNEEVLLRVELFQGGARQALGISSPFAPKANEGDPAHGLLLVDQDRVSCVPFDAEDEGAAASRFLHRARAFHSATRVGSGRQRVVLAGGARKVFRAGDPVAGEPQIEDSIELFDVDAQRFLEAGTLNSPRAFHEAVAVEADGTPRVVVVGGTTGESLVVDRLFPSVLAKSPLRFMPPAVNDRYDQEVGAGAEIITLDPETLDVSSVAEVDAPGRFAPAVVQVGAQVLVFGGIATTPDRDLDGDADVQADCDPHPGVAALDNFLCATNFSINAETGAVTVLPRMAAGRVGASAQFLPDGAGGGVVLVWGGNVNGPVGEIFPVDAAGVVSGPIPVVLAGDVAEAELRRAFFAMAALPNVANEFLVFGGEALIAGGDGRLIQESQDNAPVPNVVARLTFDVGTSTITTTRITEPALSRPSEPGSALEFDLGANVFPLAALDVLDEDNNNGNRNFSNAGERFFLSSAFADPGVTEIGGNTAARLLLVGGARGETFPQDVIFEYTFVVDGGGAVTDTLVQLSDGAGGSQHSLRRLLGAKAVQLSGLGTVPDVLLFTGGALGLPIPVGVDTFFDDLLGENFGEQGGDVVETTSPQVRRDVSFLSLRAPQAPDVIPDSCAAVGANGGEALTESAACGFANKELEDTRKDVERGFRFCAVDGCETNE